MQCLIHKFFKYFSNRNMCMLIFKNLICFHNGHGKMVFLKCFSFPTTVSCLPGACHGISSLVLKFFTISMMWSFMLVIFLVFAKGLWSEMPEFIYSNINVITRHNAIVISCDEQMSFTFIGKCLNKQKLDICICSSQDITIALCFVMTLPLISFFCFFFTYHATTHISSMVPLYLLWLIRLTNCLKMGWSLRPRRRAIQKINGIVEKIKISCPSYILLYQFRWRTC